MKTSKIPCKDCIVLVRCRMRVRNNRSGRIFIPSSTFGCKVVSKCEILTDYLNKGKFNNYYDIIDFFSKPYSEGKNE